MAKCKGCLRNVLRHSLNLCCSTCSGFMHRECIPLSREEYTSLSGKSEDWICIKCIENILPFNNITDDIEFHDVVLELKTGVSNLYQRFQEKVFVPFELNELDTNLPLFDIDPELQFFSDVNQNLLQGSDYYVEETLNHKIIDVFQGNPLFSLCHANIRCLPRNFNNLSSYLEGFDINFTVIALTETWLSDDNPGDLYTLPGYVFTGKHRSSRIGGGVGIYI